MHNTQQHQTPNNHKSALFRSHSNSFKKNLLKLNRIKRRHTHYEESADEDSEQSIFLLKDIPLKGNKNSWSKQQETAVIEQFNTSGCNWKEICNKLRNRQDEVKQHFLYIIKQVSQKIKYFISGNFQHGCSHVNHRQIKKLVEETIESDFKDQNCILPFRTRSRAMLGQIIQTFYQNYYINCDNSPKDIIQSLQSLILESKRFRKQKLIPNGDTAFLSVKSETQFIKIQSGYLSDSSSAFQQSAKETQSKPIQYCNYEHNYDDEQYEQQYQYEERRKQGIVIIVEEASQIKLMLKESGVLQFQRLPLTLTANRLGTVDSAHSNSQNLNNQSYQHFYEESELQRDCYWKQNCNVGSDE